MERLLLPREVYEVRIVEDQGIVFVHLDKKPPSVPSVAVMESEFGATGQRTLRDRRGRRRGHTGKKKDLPEALRRVQSFGGHFVSSST